MCTPDINTDSNKQLQAVVLKPLAKNSNFWMQCPPYTMFLGHNNI